MKKFVKRILIGILIFIIILVILILLIPAQFDSTYQRALSVQYESYKQMDNNKIVLLGSSGFAFGLDIDTLEKLSGRDCSLLALHGGIGLSYMIEIAKPNIQEGDTVIFEFADSDVDEIGAELVLSGIENNYEMYKFFTLNNYPELLEAYPKYIGKRLEYWLFKDYVKQDYSIDYFNDKGNLILKREECTLPVDYDEEVYGIGSWNTTFNPEFIEIVNDFDEYCENLGADLLITRRLYIDESVKSTEEEIIASDKALDDLLSAPLITNSLDIIFPRELMYDTILHTNSKGATLRTELLYEDMLSYYEISK